MRNKGEIEIEARSLREALAALGERSLVGVVVSDPMGVIVYASARARRMLGAANRAILPWSYNSSRARLGRARGTKRVLG